MWIGMTKMMIFEWLWLLINIVVHNDEDNNYKFYTTSFLYTQDTHKNWYNKRLLLVRLLLLTSFRTYTGTCPPAPGITISRVRRIRRRRRRPSRGISSSRTRGRWWGSSQLKRAWPVTFSAVRTYSSTIIITYWMYTWSLFHIFLFTINFVKGTSSVSSQHGLHFIA